MPLLGLLGLFGMALGAPRMARADAPTTAEALFKVFATMPGLEARFVEEKHLALLARPLVSEGRLYFSRPGTLARVVTKPRESRVVISPEAIVAYDGAHAEHIQLGGRPTIKLFVESFVRVLAGDFGALKAVYGVRYARGADRHAWTLTLTPKDARLGQLITRLVLRGADRYVQEIRVIEASGDRTVTHISQANPARTFTAEERQRLFGAPAP